MSDDEQYHRALEWWRISIDSLCFKDRLRYLYSMKLNQSINNKQIAKLKEENAALQNDSKNTTKLIKMYEERLDEEMNHEIMSLLRFHDQDENIRRLTKEVDSLSIECRHLREKVSEVEEERAMMMIRDRKKRASTNPTDVPNTDVTATPTDTSPMDMTACHLTQQLSRDGWRVLFGDDRCESICLKIASFALEVDDTKTNQQST